MSVKFAEGLQAGQSGETGSQPGSSPQRNLDARHPTVHKPELNLSVIDDIPIRALHKIGGRINATFQEVDLIRRHLSKSG